MVVRRDSGAIEHRRFSDIVDLVPGGDVLVVNRSRVHKARLLGPRVGSGAPAEVLLLRAREGDVWEAMVSPGGKLKPGRRVTIAPELEVEVLETTDRRTRLVRLHSALGFQSPVEYEQSFNRS